MLYMLLVAREPRVIRTVKTTLGRPDYGIGTVDSPAKAVEVLQHVLFDCLLIEAHLLDCDDGRLTDLALARKIPFLLLVGPSDRLSLFQQKSPRYLRLPFDRLAFEARLAGRMQRLAKVDGVPEHRPHALAADGASCVPVLTVVARDPPSDR